MMMSARSAMTSCSSASAIMYFCEAAPAVNSASFFAEASMAASRASRSSGPESPSLKDGGDMTSSISLLMAGSSGSWPDIARFIRNPVMMSRLISLVPSKIRLMRESR
jgi:hypothetical protein